MTSRHRIDDTCSAPRSTERGAAMVEFAVVVPVLFALLFSIIQFGIAYNRVQALHAAAREGARTAALSTSSSADINARVTSALGGVTFDTPPSVSITPGSNNPCEDRQGESVRVELSAPYTIELPLLFSQTITLEGHGEFRCEA